MVGPADTSVATPPDDAVWPPTFEGRDLADPQTVVRDYLRAVVFERAVEIERFAADGPDRGTAIWRSGPAEGTVELRRAEGRAWYVVEARSDRIDHTEGALGAVAVKVAGQLETIVDPDGGEEEPRLLSIRLGPRDGAVNYSIATRSWSGGVTVLHRLGADDGAVSIAHYRVVEAPSDPASDAPGIAAPHPLWPEVTFTGDDPEVAVSRPLIELYQSGPAVVELAKESGSSRVYDYEGPGTASGQVTVRRLDSPLGRTWYATEVRSDGVEVLSSDLVGGELRVRVRAVRSATLTFIATAIGADTSQHDRPTISVAAGEVITLTDRATSSLPQRALIQALRPDEPGRTSFWHYSLLRVDT